MRIGVHITRFDGRETRAIAGDLGDACQAAEDAGVAWLSVMDHWFQMDRALPAEDPMLEAYTTLGYLAARTTSVQLGVLVTGVTYRHPGLLAKITTTLDVLSGGRATLGIGAAWYEREHLGLGVPFPPLAERFERLEETLQICLQMWDPEANGPFEGTHYRLAETLCSPQPISRPRPEILIGGSGERKTLRLVATYGDACNFFLTSPEEIGRKLDVLHAHCDDVGRDPAEIRVTMLDTRTPGALGDPLTYAQSLAPYAALGVDTMIVMPPPGPLAPWVAERVAPAVQRLADLG